MKLDDGTSMRLYRQTVEDFGLFAGKELDEAEFNRLQDAASLMSAKMRAVRIISASSVSKGDLQRRLVEKGENKQDALKAVAWLAEMDLLDDQKTAQQVVQNCIAKGYGRSRAKQALYEKRIPKEYWDEVLENYPDQTDKILAFLQKRLKEEWSEKDLRKATDALLRRGHSYQQICRALEEFSQNADLQEDMYG
ncbi:MAG: RecX family transcriptional regulator [Oscillospiraceae bacterium]|nr:RecX family transcriptional regulator [Oscillospiraceae bacterium]